MQTVKVKLTLAFLMVDISLIRFYLGLKVDRDREKQTIKLSQLAYIDKMLDKFHHDWAYTINTPIKEMAILK